MRAARHHAQHVLRDQLGRRPARPGARDGAQHEPAAGPHEARAGLEERRRVAHVLHHLPQRQHVVPLSVGRGRGEALDTGLHVLELTRAVQRRVLRGVPLRDAEHLGRGVDGRDVRGVREARGALGEDAAAAAHVEVSELLGRRLGVRGEAGGDEVMAERVHEVEQARRPVRIPPCRRELLEVRDLGGVDGRGGQAAGGETGMCGSVERQASDGLARSGHPGLSKWSVEVGMEDRDFSNRRRHGLSDCLFRMKDLAMVRRPLPPFAKFRKSTVGLLHARTPFASHTP